jgi:hypothetical protein
VKVGFKEFERSRYLGDGVEVVRYVCGERVNVLSGMYKMVFV